MRILDEFKGEISRSVLLAAVTLATATACAASGADKWPGTVDSWLASGPWPSYQGDGAGALDTDFLDLETDAVPVKGMKAESTFIADKAKLIAGIGSVNEWGFKETKTFDASWRQIDADAQGIVTLDGVFKPIDDYFAAYACCYVAVPEAVDARLAVGSDDDHKLWLNLAQIGRRASSQGVTPGEFKYDVRLSAGVHRILLKVVDRTQSCGFTLAVTDREDKAIPGVRFFTDPSGHRLVIEDQKAAERTPEKLRAANEALEKELAELKARLPDLKSRQKELAAKVAAAERALAVAYERVEEKYAEQHAREAALGAKSSDDPLPPAPATRRRLCINGEWDVSADGGKSWERRPVPIVYIDRYFAAGRYPVARTNPKTPWCAYTNLAGFADFKVSDTLFGDHNRSLRLRTTFDWDGAGTVNYVSEGIIGEAKFFCNGTPCGEYCGRMGIVTVPLKGAVKGRNTIEIELKWAWCQQHHNTDGLLGDTFIDYVSPVRVKEVYAKPSWRRSTLCTEIELVNESADAVAAEVRAYAVKDGRVRLALPVAKAKVAPGGEAKVEPVARWADPVLWGIGGKYGEPEMYDLVTDVVVDSRIVDRHVQPFGFREFWVHYTDFFLNGKRIILQGDTGHPGISTGRRREITWDLLRRDGINIVRYHDSEFWSINAARAADRMGMLCYLQMYPVLHRRALKKPSADNFEPFEEWEKTAEHAFNLANYERWFRAFRNSPSAVIWSTDNEIFTQTWDTAGKAEFNVRNDRVGALYGQFMKKLDPRLVITRDGDVGTWGSKGRWHEEPPCDTANYHYPDFNVETWVRDWQRVYEWRPAVFGETLYTSYGAWDNWVGAKPEVVRKKALRVRRIASLYRELGVPGQIYMGLSSDGFIGRDDTGKGNPQGITEAVFKSWRENGVLPPGQAADQFPWLRLDWPALSGSEYRPIAASVIGHNWIYGHDAINAYDPRYPSHVRNAVNDAYRDSLIPQAPLRLGPDAEAIVEAEPNEDVWAVSPDGARTIGVRADAKGRAWFRFIEPGRWTFRAGDATRTVELAPRGDKVLKPGFAPITTIKLSIGGRDV